MYFLFAWPVNAFCVNFPQDGTLTVAHIDFADMRARTHIPAGDLFTVMEAWPEAAKIKRSMDIILDIEAEAATRVSLKPGCVVRALLHTTRAEALLHTDMTAYMTWLPRVTHEP